MGVRVPLPLPLFTACFDRSFLFEKTSAMSQKSTEQADSQSADKPKILLAIALLVASVFGYYYFSDVHAAIRVVGLLLGVALSGWVFYLTQKGQAWFRYVTLAKKEVQMVHWPSRQDTVRMTLIVFVVVILMGIFLWLVDMFFLWAVQLLTGQGG